MTTKEKTPRELVHELFDREEEIEHYQYNILGHVPAHEDGLPLTSPVIKYIKQRVQIMAKIQEECQIVR